MTHNFNFQKYLPIQLIALGVAGIWYPPNSGPSLLLITMPTIPRYPPIMQPLNQFPNTFTSLVGLRRFLKISFGL